MKADYRIVRTMCDLCHCECGVLAHVQDGKVIKIEGDPNCPINEGHLCPKGLAAIQLLYHPERKEEFFLTIQPLSHKLKITIFYKSLQGEGTDQIAGLKKITIHPLYLYPFFSIWF
jgi:hypothetical protein